MTKEFLTRFTCDKCGHTSEVCGHEANTPIDWHVIKTVDDAGTLVSWLLCAKCYQIFSRFMRNGKNAL